MADLSAPRSSGSSSSGSSKNETPETTQQVTTPEPSTPEFMTPESMSQPPCATRKRRVRRITRPSKDSLYDIFHEHVGTSLFVRPICWSDLHAKLLGVTFEELPPCDTPLPANVPGSPPSKGHMRPSQTITTLSDALTEILQPATAHPALSSSAARTILSTLWPSAFSKSMLLPELHMFFGGRVYRDAVRTQVVWNHPPDSNNTQASQSSFKSISTRPAESYGFSAASSPVHNPTGLPMMCYVGKNQLAAVRKNLFRIATGPGRSWNAPVFRLQQMRSKMLIPANSDHDVHFVGIFLSMAQRHFYTLPLPSSRRDSQWSSSNRAPPRPAFHDLKLRILTHDEDTAEFIIYTGYVTAKFLERFHDPCKTPSSEDGSGVPGMRIDYTKVPIWPILGLRERLGKALGEDVVGSFDPADMETWEDDVTLDHSNGKRKRKALSEVFNGSFTDDSDDDEPCLDGKKRCLSPGPPIGVVV